MTPEQQEIPTAGGDLGSGQYLLGKGRASGQSGRQRSDRPPRLPLWLKVAYSIWFAFWVVNYWQANGPQNFLWICDLGNFVLLVALWSDSRILVSGIAAAVLLLQGFWAVDFLGRLVLGFHPIGGTEYMWDEGKALSTRLHSLFHLWVPVLLVVALRRLGYDRRAVRWVVVAGAALFPLTWLLTEPERNINWLWQPFGLELPWLPTPAVMILWILLYPSMVVLPVHWLLIRLHGVD